MMTDAMIPTAMPVSAPAVVNRRQYSASSSGGKFALAANTNATLTSTVTLKPEPTASVARIAAAPTASAAKRPAARSFSSVPRLSTFVHRSCVIAPAEASTSPATTARIVANAAALNSARAMSPPVEPSPPNSACEVSGAARLPPLPTASSAPEPRIARAPKPMIVTSTVKIAIRLIVHTTDVRAALALGTVKKRISTCGRPAVPMKIVRPVEITSTGVLR
jgi:hypothetical protein